ncbi:hypothetical protein SSJG_03217 [Escherichia coli D9]|nr:hypothetical protein SSJG_03217 [Escherichia coli D9]
MCLLLISYVYLATPDMSSRQNASIEYSQYLNHPIQPQHAANLNETEQQRSP